ncbi:MAG TPA: hypothetical protein VN231_04260 [Allosphingosinicella sp.]|nr:hypothetical protein [Allosphingosinicella sp.]
MIVSLLGLVISLFAYMIAFPDPQTRRFDIYAALFALHILGSVGFWLMSFESAMDAFLYYRDPFHFINEDPFASGTFFVVHFVQNIRHWLGGSFFDHFLFFQCFGMIGMALLIRSINEIAASLNLSVPLFLYFTLFLPGLHFWTAGIGKDGPMFMAICLAGWAVFRINKRFVWMGLALVIMACIRPHITPFVAAGIVGGLLLTQQIPARFRLFLAPVAFAGLIIFLGRAAESLNITLDVNSVTGFVEGQQELGGRFGSGNDLASLPLPMKIFTLLYRPFWIDAGGLMGLAASLENTILMYFSLYILFHFKLLYRLSRNVFYVMYFIIFDALLILSLSLVSYNIGMGQRMKMMAVPGILLLFATIYLYKRSFAAQPAPLPQPLPEQAGHQAPAKA